MELAAVQGRGLAHAPAAAATGARRRRPPAAAPQQQRPPPSSRRPALAAAAAPGDAAQPSTQQPPEALHAGPPSPPPTPAEVEAAASSAPAFAAVLRRLVERGGGATEAHVVAAWATQRHSPALRLAPAGAARRVSHKQQEVLEALVLLEELTRQQLVALAPDQLGFVARCYVLAGGSHKPVLLGMQQAACSWGPHDFSAAGLAELAWALASCGQPLSDGCRQLLRAALQGSDVAGQPDNERIASGKKHAGERAAGDAGPPPADAAPGQRLQRDWQAWFEGTPASRIVLLLWSAARLGCRPASECLAAAAAALRRDRGLATLPSKALVTLLWALATLRAAQDPQPQLQHEIQPLLQAASRQLAERMEDSFGGPPAAVTPSAQTEGAAPPGGGAEEADERWFSGAAAAPAAAAAAAAAASVGQPALPTSTLCTAVWACGQLRHSDPRLLQAVATLLHGRVMEMDSGDIARRGVLWGLGQLGVRPDQLLITVSLRLQQPGVLAAFSPRQLAMAAYAFATLDFFPGQDCVDLLADAALASRQRLEPRALSHVLWNMSRLGYVDDPFFLAFVPVILPNISKFGPAEVADVARVYARCGLNPTAEEAAAGSGGGSGGSGGGTLFDALAQQTMARIQGADLQDVLRIMTAFHQMGLQPDQLLAAVETWANQRLQKLSPQALSLALWSFARLGSSSPKLLETSAACAEQQLQAFTAGQLAKVAWAFAKLRWPAPRVLRHAGAQLAARTSAFADKEASNVLWALASGGETVPAEELDQVAANLQLRLAGFSPQSLANIAWAYATLGHAPAPPFLPLLADAALCQLHAFEPQGISLLVWSLASLGSCQNKLFREIVRLCSERPVLLRQFEGQHLANLLWGLCRAGFKPPLEFLELMAREAELRVCDLKSQELFNIAWAFTQLGHYPKRLFDAVAREVAPRAFAFTPQELSVTLWALAKAGHSGRTMPPLLDAVERELASRSGEWEDRHLAIMAWSCGQLGHTPAPATCARLAAELERRVPAMSGRSLATLASGLAAMEQQRLWQLQQLQQQGPEGSSTEEEAEATAEPAAAAAEAGPDAHPVLPPHLVEMVVERAGPLLPRMQPFEVARLAYSCAVLGSDAAAQLLLRAPAPATLAQLQAAAERAPLPTAIGLLWAMVRWDCYPRRLFSTLCNRLQQTSRHYRLSQPALALLGEAVLAMGQQQRGALHLRQGLEHAALATARQAALHGPQRLLISPHTGASLSSGEASDAEAGWSEEDEPGASQQARRRRGSTSPAQPPAAYELHSAADLSTAPPRADNSNEDDLSWLEMTYDDLAGLA